jgi:4-hydroxybenzoate polyprenyltransferase
MKKLLEYARLMRLDKPIGIYLLLWPTLWALWLASQGPPKLSILIIFILGVIIMRSAGCVINDIIDRKFDGFVARTQYRPLVTQVVSVSEAYILSAGLLSIALGLVLLLDPLTLQLAVFGASFVVMYPFMKRFTHLPQLGLGIAFSWGIPLAFAAVAGRVPEVSWILFAAACMWPIIYDTQYAMVDRQDDVKIGIKSTAILFGRHDKLIIGVCQIVFLSLLIAVGVIFQLTIIYYLSLCVASILFCYQQVLLKQRIPSQCFKAFLHNHWVGAIIFLGIVLSYL